MVSFWICFLWQRCPGLAGVSPHAEQQRRAGVLAPVPCIQGLHPASHGDGDSVL